jgi:hypothetical protein
VQYDKGKDEDGGKFVVKGQLNKPPQFLLNTLSKIVAEHELNASKVSDFINEALKRNAKMKSKGYAFQTEPDCLKCSLCDRDIESPSANCDGTHIERNPRESDEPAIHYGTIASANQVIKDAVVRDRLQDKFNALCVEMEAAGLMDAFPCLVIRGICDYADKHKNDVWHPYAAMTAAAYAKEFLQYLSPAQAKLEKPIQDIVGR